MQKIHLLLLLSLVSLPAYAQNYTEFDNEFEQKQFRTKLFISGGFLDGKLTDLPSTNGGSINKLSEYVYGVAGSTSIFMNNYISLEIGLGFSAYRFNNSVLKNIHNNYSDPGAQEPSYDKTKHFFGIPIAAQVQYNITPYGGLNFFVGGGYCYNFFVSNIKTVDIKNSHGPIIHIGMDFVAKDGLLYNFSVSKMFSAAKIVFDNIGLNLNTNNTVGGKVVLNPTVVSIGIGYHF